MQLEQYPIDHLDAYIMYLNIFITFTLIES